MKIHIEPDQIIEPQPRPPKSNEPVFSTCKISNGSTRFVLDHIRYRRRSIGKLLKELPPGIISFDVAERICREVGVPCDSKYVVWHVISRELQRMRLIEGTK